MSRSAVRLLKGVDAAPVTLIEAEHQRCPLSLQYCGQTSPREVFCSES